MSASEANEPTLVILAETCMCRSEYEDVLALCIGVCLSTFLQHVSSCSQTNSVQHSKKALTRSAISPGTIRSLLGQPDSSSFRQAAPLRC